MYFIEFVMLNITNLQLFWAPGPEGRFYEFSCVRSQICNLALSFLCNTILTGVLADDFLLIFGIYLGYQEHFQKRAKKGKKAPYQFFPYNF